MTDVPMSSFGEDKAQREEWRAAHLLLSVAVAVLVPENLTRLLCRKTAPPLPATPAWPSRLIHKEDAATWSKYYFTREAAVKRLVEINDEDYGAFKSIEDVSTWSYRVATDGSDSRSPIGTQETREPTQLPLWSLAWRICTCTARATPERPRRSPRFAKDGRCAQSIEAVKLARAMTTPEAFTKLG